jgi:hypothetical protein
MQLDFKILLKIVKIGLETCMRWLSNDTDIFFFLKSYSDEVMFRGYKISLCKGWCNGVMKLRMGWVNSPPQEKKKKIFFWGGGLDVDLVKVPLPKTRPRV